MPNRKAADTPVIAHFLYQPGDGGLDRVSILLANAMAERGYRTELWLTRRDGAIADLISDKLTVRTVPAPKLGNRGFRLVLQIPALVRMIRKHQPDALLSAGNQSNLTIAIARKFARRSRTKIIQKITNPIIRPGMGRLRIALRRWRFGLTARIGDRCLTLSVADGRSYAQLFPRAADKFHPVRNAYVTPEMLELGEKRGVKSSGEPARLLAVGRVAKQKNYSMMIRALHEIREIDWHLTVLGDGPLLPEVRTMVNDLNLGDRIDFKGFVQNPSEYYAKADILLLSSRWEGFPAVPLEAMAAGCDVVATDCAAGLTEILQTAGRKTTPVGDSNAFAAATTRAIMDSNPRGQLLKIAAHYSIEASVDDHLRHFEELAN